MVGCDRILILGQPGQRRSSEPQYQQGHDRLCSQFPVHPVLAVRLPERVRLIRACKWSANVVVSCSVRKPRSETPKRNPKAYSPPSETALSPTSHPVIRSRPQ